MTKPLSNIEAATAEYLDSQSRSHLSDSAWSRLAARVAMSPAEARALLHRWRRESRYRMETEDNARPTEAREPLTYLSPETLAAGDSGDLDRIRQIMTWSGGVETDEGETAKPNAEINHDPAALAQATRFLLDYFSRKLLASDVDWRYYRARLLGDNELVEIRIGPGEIESPAGPVSWLICAVVIRERDSAKILDVLSDCRIRRRLRRKHGVALQLQRPAITTRLDYREAVRRMAASLILYRGQVAGLLTQKQLADAAGVQKQSLNEMVHRLADHYRKQTGGRSGFSSLKA